MIKRNWARALVTAGLLLGLVIGGSTAGRSSAFQEASVDTVKKGGFSVAASCHDPQIIRDGDTYYMFGSHMVAAQSGDLRKWNDFANGVDASNPLFDNLLTEPFAAFDFVGKNTDGGYSVWASNVIYNETMKKYVMYFCTTSSYIRSNLCFATADAVEGPYTYVDTIVYSGFGKSDIDQTNLYDVLGPDADISRYLEYGGYNNKVWPNCIDPAIFTDEDGRMWMDYGSWSGGIFLLEIDPKTGYPIYPVDDEAADPYYGYRLIGGGHHSVEGPYIQYDAGSGYYYLFVSYGNLQSDGGYQIRQFRSKSPTGPYVDVAGNTLDDQDDHFNYGLKMMGNYTFPSLNYTYMAPGGQSTFQDEDGTYYITYHQRFDDGSEYHEPRVHQMYTNEDGWFVAAPFATMGERRSENGYTQKDVSGTFYVVNHGTDISSKVNGAVAYTFADGVVTGADAAGTYEVKPGTDYITIQLGDATYKGVLIEMTDEAGNPVFCFSAAGDNEETIWGVQYLKTK